MELKLAISQTISIILSERPPIRTSLLGHVDLLNVHLCDRRLDDLVQAVHAHND